MADDHVCHAIAFSTYALLAAVTGVPANVQATVLSDTKTTTVSRARASNVATIVLFGLLSPVLAIGQTVNIASHGGTGYNGTVVLTGVSTGGGNTTITYASTGSNEPVTHGRPGRCVNAFRVGIKFSNRTTISCEAKLSCSASWSCCGIEYAGRGLRASLWGQMQYEEHFETDRGYRLFCGGRSLLLHSLSVGGDFPVKQRSKFARLGLNYLERLEGRGITTRVNPKPMLELDFPALKRPTFFKFLPPDTASYWRHGSFRLGTPSYYRNIEDEKRADKLEGFATVMFQGKRKCLNIFGTSGFNSLMLCGVARPPRDHRNLRDMRHNFGAEIAEITDVSAFMTVLARRLAGCTYHIRDVRYIDGKYMLSMTDEFEGYLSEFGYGDLADETIHAINVRYWASLYPSFLWPACFSKPLRFSRERERRMLFEFPSDIPCEKIDVDAPEALEFIRFESHGQPG